MISIVTKGRWENSGINMATRGKWPRAVSFLSQRIVKNIQGRGVGTGIKIKGKAG